MGGFQTRRPPRSFEGGMGGGGSGGYNDDSGEPAAKQMRGGGGFNQMFRGRGYGAGGGFAPPQSGKYVFKFSNLHILYKQNVRFRF